ncbi:MAG TPA: crosslink repair DNA glycosylase YcaQ family protein, partial [Vineibacter sp.]|nr:crosslink repair DNA glycosylase YcaQ family protein [Vineibacter sp.]
MQAKDKLSAAAARRIALAAQGFATSRPDAPVGLRQVRKAIDRLGLLQIDSVNVLVRAHYLPLFSRLGRYETGLLDRLAYDGKRRGLFEFWGHEASLLPAATQPLWRWRMARAAKGEDVGRKFIEFRRRRHRFIKEVRAELADRGPLAASDLSRGGRGNGAWWGWSDGKHALEWLFFAGEVTTAHRRGNFERVYDLTERVLPASLLATPTPSPDDAQRALLRIAARSLGVATETDLRDYYRLGVADTRARLGELVEAGELLPVAVEDWRHPAFLHRDARRPRRIEARALLAPFDPLIWKRDRTERLFDFHYRIGIYTPAHLRAHGYYVLPFLLDDRLAARVDLKADRAGRRLLVRAGHVEAGIVPAAIAGPLGEELRLMAT